MVSKKANRVQKIFVLDTEKPDHKLLNDCMSKLENGLQGALITRLLTEFFMETKEEPNIAVKRYLFNRQNEV